MRRWLYLRWMQFRRRHVLAPDCWCHPKRESYRPDW